MRRLPAEWESQDAIMLTWPHKDTDWAAVLDEAEATYRVIANAILKHCHLLVVAVPEMRDELRKTLADLSPNCGYKSAIITIASDDTWARDHGPICVSEAGTSLCDERVVLDFTFNGWGNKFPATHDNAITSKLWQKQVLSAEKFEQTKLVLEGGAIESDGCGTLLTTTACLLNPNRNPNLNKSEIERILSEKLGAEKVLWLEHGYLAGDDTDSHIDTLARFAPNNGILYVSCDDQNDEHFQALSDMENDIKAFKSFDNKAFTLIRLPWPCAKYDAEGHRLPATYANFLVVNNAILVPTYKDENDQKALRQVQTAFPEHEVYGIDCSILIKQHGSLHCITMQIPKGFLNPNIFNDSPVN